MFTVAKVNYYLIVVVLFFSVVFPNVLKPVVVTFMFLSFLLSLPYIKVRSELKVFYLMFLFSALVTIFFICLGLHNGAPENSVLLVTFIYIISPLLWLVILTFFVQYFTYDKIVSLLVLFSILGCISVAVYFYLFLNYGPSSVSFFESGTNVNMNSDGYSGAIMHVFGSLIFLGGGFFFYPNVIKSLNVKFFILLIIFLTMVFAGRTALTLAIVLSSFMFFTVLSVKFVLNRYSSIKFFFIITLTIFVFFSLIIVIREFSGVDFLYIASVFFDKSMSGGGGARVEQASALFEGIENSFVLGKGHGVGVDYIRSDDFPWRYELVWIATVLRVGFIGAFIYSIPYMFYLFIFFKRMKGSQLTSLDKFFFGSWVAVFLASNTNPYIEAFSFQWMFIMPLVFLFNDTTSNSYEKA